MTLAMQIPSRFTGGYDLINPLSLAKHKFTANPL
jgi:hypothetical protein